MRPALKSALPPLAEFPAGTETALAALLRAYDYAEEFRRPVWDFAVEMNDLRAAEFTASDLRWLVCRGYVEHAVEATPEKGGQRLFRPAGESAVSEASCVVLTAAGAAFARSRCGRPSVRPDRAPRTLPLNGPVAIAEAASRPHWDPVRRILRLGERVVKHFRQPAPKQETVLDAFEEEGWPPHIDDPLPPRSGRDRRQQLRDTINSLNRYQEYEALRFTGDGRGQGICWEALR